jgi:4-amino-4-deoxy-L-arabinose transferase-like glycosyltransferase
LPKTINRPQTEPITKPKFERTLVAVMVLLFIVLTFWAAMAGIRGTDQYWYLADSQSLISGHGVHTNVIYPISARFAKPDYLLPFIHNILNIYLAAGFGFLAGAYWGWILLNLVSSLLTAFLIYKILRRYADERLSLMVSSMYLLIPLTFWQTTQLLAEASITPLVALGAYLFLNSDRKFSRWLLLMTVVGLLLISRASFLPLIPLVPLAFLLCNRPLKAIHVVQALVLLVVGTVFYFIMKYVLVQNAPVEMTKILTTGTQSNLSNMALYFDITKHSPQISEMLHTFITKLIRNLMVQLVPRSFTNLLMFIP